MNGSPPAGRARTLRWIAWSAGAALVIGAIIALWLSAPRLTEISTALRRPSGILLALALCLPVGNWLATSALFWILTRRHAPISARDMSALIGAACLLNYLPIRPGLAGRVAYQKTVYGLSVARSGAIVVEAIACSAVAALLALGVAMAAQRLGIESPVHVVWVGLGGVALLLAGLPAAARSARAAYLGALGARTLDMALWIARYAVVFALMGTTLTFAQAAALAIVSQVAMLVPLVGNGLGLREWGVALVAAALPKAWFGSGIPGYEVGLAADLLNRAAEVIVALPIGVLSIGALVRSRRRHAGRAGSAREPLTTPEGSSVSIPPGRAETPDPTPHAR